jgi:hypothetical protein
MRPQLEDIQLLEGYLQCTLSAEQRTDVEIRLLWDREWQQNLAAQQMTYQALLAAGRQQLRRELEAIHARLFG